VSRDRSPCCRSNRTGNDQFRCLYLVRFLHHATVAIMEISSVQERLNSTRPCFTQALNRFVMSEIKT
jgi:hypothetical protein